ncbi:PHP domain-containing protein [Cohnella rhizosphaerae]|uniref:PHP domain-containing protein n=1 Tax=Cohnella rhizosphaerae TaxID=1457232 RepID=A0A9X4KXG1_9BACL|nr:PHP domain-containing protein [Cohnella rhizosphaerae]MDG0812318.1 PHP domain-containing protein [Cohnella rhizosphaerae]
MNRADLHTHTTASDGLHKPSDNVRMAAEAGLAAIGITDHDTVAGLDEARQAARTYGVEVVPGVEISTAHDGQDIHILGYFADDRDPVFLARLASQRRVRDSRNELIVARLNELGVRLSWEAVLDAAGRDRGPDETVGRPHIAEALVRMGAVSSLQEAFDRYLAEGKPAYVLPPRIAPAEAIAWIHEAGGAAVVAHPGLYGADDTVEALLRDGVADGVEAYHSDHTAEDERRYADMAARYGVVATGGSDFHGERKGRVYHGPIGSRSADADVVRALMGRAKDRRAARLSDSPGDGGTASD